MEVAPQPPMPADPFPHLTVTTRPDGSTLVVNHEKDVAQAYTVKERRHG